MLACRRNNPDASGAGTIEISFLIHSYPIRSAWGFIRRGVQEQNLITHGAVRLDTIAQPDFPTRLGYVQELLIWRERNAVGPAKILNDKLKFLSVGLRSRLLLARRRNAIDSINL